MKVPASAIGLGLCVIAVGGIASAEPKPDTRCASNEQRDRMAVTTLAKQALGSTDSIDVEVMRREDLDDILLGVAGESPMVCGYVATPLWREMRDPDHRVVHASTGSRTVLVVIDNAGTAYALQGAPEEQAISNFSRLASSLGVRLGSSEAVLQYFWRFADVGVGTIDRVARSGLHARNLVEAWSLRQRGDIGLEKTMKSWWSSNRTAAGRIAPPSVSQKAQNYLISYYVVEGGAVWERQVEISPLGALHALNAKLLCPAPLLKGEPN